MFFGSRPIFYTPIDPRPRYVPPVLRRNDAGLGWFIDTKIQTNTTPSGHEILTDRAARGLVSGADLRTLIQGVRLPDLADPNDHIKRGEEKRHFLRPIKQLAFDAWWQALQHLKSLHAQMMAAPNRTDELMSIGEALHLIQDSFAPAHVERDPTNGDILSIRAYDPQAGPTDHALLTDSRDDIFRRPANTLTKESAQAVAASREFLQMALKHLRLKNFPFGTPQWMSQQTRSDVNAFIARRLWFRMPDVHAGGQGWPVSVFNGQMNPWIAINASQLPLLKGNTLDADAQQALKVFQQSNGLMMTGVLDRSTWKKLIAP